jgi:hypothetical protein
VSMLNPRSPVIGCLFSAKRAFENSIGAPPRSPLCSARAPMRLTTFAAVTRWRVRFRHSSYFSGDFVWRVVRYSRLDLPSCFRLKGERLLLIKGTRRL